MADYIEGKRPVIEALRAQMPMKCVMLADNLQQDGQVKDILRKARLAKGKRLLESRSMTIAEVAYEVGFSAPSYFTKCFKDEYGMLPGDIANS